MSHFYKMLMAGEVVLIVIVPMDTTRLQTLAIVIMLSLCAEYIGAVIREK